MEKQDYIQKHLIISYVQQSRWLRKFLHFTFAPFAKLVFTAEICLAYRKRFT